MPADEELIGLSRKLAERGGAEPSDESAERLRRRLERERAARQHAEALLEQKSLELYQANATLRELNQTLETTVAARTEDLRQALKSAQEAKRLFAHNAQHDTLTGLPNRRYLRSKLDELVLTAARRDSVLAILHIDLDRFKQINDTLGHAAGDGVLKHAAGVQREVAEQGEFVARIGGDEFVIAKITDDSAEPVRDLAEAVVKRMAEPAIFNGAPVRFGASVGVAHARGLSVDAGQLMVNADIALYRAKACGRGRVAFFTEALEAEMHARKRLADELLEALERAEFIPFYHPRVRTRDGAIDCVEALARWRHPARGLLAPAAWLEVANDLGFTSRIDDMILTAALTHLRGWRAAGVRIPRISVNVSHARLTDPDLIDKRRALDLPPKTLSFELLESIFLDNTDEELIARIETIKSLGIDVEIDDFGSGHASIIGVINVRPDAIKIDRRIVSGLVRDDRHSGLVKAIVDIAASLGAKVVAEGIEDVADLEMCARLGCGSVQGFAIARPMDAGAMATFAEQNRGWGDAGAGATSPAAEQISERG